MRRVHEILRQKLELGRSHREVAASLGVSVGVVASVLRRLERAGLSWGDVQGQAEPQLDERLYGPKLVMGATRPAPDCIWIHVERRRPGVTAGRR
jgi:hypothetical protein